MLLELAVTQLGVIEHTATLFADGMTTLTGETGAGKTMVVQAISILLGGRADASLVRDGADEAVVEGRFEHEGVEVILRRTVPRSGRTRAYVDGRLATVAELTEIGQMLIAIHGQHTHRLLSDVAEQRRALDRFGNVDLSALTAATERIAEIDTRLEAIGGDVRERAREIDLLTHQTDELRAAAIEDADEDERLESLEDLLADATAHREVAHGVVDEFGADGGLLDRMRIARAALGDRTPFIEEAKRLDALLAEADDIVATLRGVVDAIADDPRQLADVRARRQLLYELRRKYGDTLREVIDFAEQTEIRLGELSSSEALAADLEERRRAAHEEMCVQQRLVKRAREETAPLLCSAIESRLASLAMERARIVIDVGGDDGSDVVFKLAANSGATPQPIGRVASGGELARTMLAVQLELNTGPDTLIFDEVDAGVGGETALSVGASLAEASHNAQVIVVTHLAQVAAYADHQVTIRKSDDGSKAVAKVSLLSLDERVGELSRMLGGDSASASGREHAKELLDSATRHGTGGRQ